MNSSDVPGPAGLPGVPGRDGLPGLPGPPVSLPPLARPCSRPGLRGTVNVGTRPLQQLSTPHPQHPPGGSSLWAPLGGRGPTGQPGGSGCRAAGDCTQGRSPPWPHAGQLAWQRPFPGVTLMGQEWALLPGEQGAQRGPCLADLLYTGSSGFLCPSSQHRTPCTVARRVPGGVAVEAGSQEPGVCSLIVTRNMLRTEFTVSCGCPAEGLRTFAQESASSPTSAPEAVPSLWGWPPCLSPTI